MARGGTIVDSSLECGATALKVYKINSKGINYLDFNVRSDGNTKDFITDYLINGRLNTTYRKIDEFEYEFTDKALYNFNGFEKTISQENE